MAEKRNRNGASRRTAKRVTLRVGFEVSGRDYNGRRFAVLTETRNVCRDGGCLVLDRDIKSGDTLKLKNFRGTQFIARVHWCLFDPRRNVRLIGFRLSEGSRSWVVNDGSVAHRALMKSHAGAYAVTRNDPSGSQAKPNAVPYNRVPRQRAFRSIQTSASSFLDRVGVFFKNAIQFRVASRPLSLFRTD